MKKVLAFIFVIILNCGFIKSSCSFDEVDTISSWVCPSCNYSNDEDVMHCKICGRYK